MTNSRPPLRRRPSRTAKRARRPLIRRKKPRLQFEWARAITQEHWNCYRLAIRTLRDSGIPFLLGGGFALAAYTGRWRNTKDIDFYIFQKDRQTVVNALSKAGFEDYYAQLPYDRKWIYRSTCSGVIVDTIWAMANQRAQVDSLWFDRARPFSIRGEPLALVPLEEFTWCKLYILQRDHCDWTDVFNLLYAASQQMDWNHLLWRLEDDRLLLRGLLSVYEWLCPRSAGKLPGTLRRKLKLPPPGRLVQPRRDRIRLLDSRGWFAAALPTGKPLEV